MLCPFSSASPRSLTFKSFRSAPFSTDFKSSTCTPCWLSRCVITDWSSAPDSGPICEKLSGLRMCNSNESVFFAGISKYASSVPALILLRRSVCTASESAGRTNVCSTTNSGLPSSSLLFSPCTTDCESPSELSTIANRRLLSVLWFTRKTIIRQNASPSSGTASVPITNPLVFTRVRYSRLTISPSLRTGGPLDEDLVQRRVHQFKLRDICAGLQRGAQDFLRIGARLQFRFRAVAKPREFFDRWRLQKCVRTGEFKLHRVFSVRLFDRPDVAVQNVLSLVDQADRVAHPLDLVHAVARKHDRRAFALHLHDDFFNRRGVHRVKPRRRLVQNHHRRLVNHRSDELHLLLHALRKIHQLLRLPLAESQFIQPLIRAPPRLRFRQPVQRREKHDDVAHFHSRIQPALFRQVSDQVSRVVAHLLVEHFDRAFVGHQNVHDHSDCGCLAGAIRPQQSKNRALPYAHAHVAHCRNGVVGFRYFFECDGVHRLVVALASYYEVTPGILHDSALI